MLAPPMVASASWSRHPVGTERGLIPGEEGLPASHPPRLLDRGVLEQDLPRLDEVVKAERPARLPVVHTQGEVQGVLRQAGIPKRATCHTLRYSSATHLFQGAHLQAVQKLLRHRDASTGMLYTHVLKRGPAAVPSPADWNGKPVRGVVGPQPDTQTDVRGYHGSVYRRGPSRRFPAKPASYRPFFPTTLHPWSG